ncbi:MAG: hypothetical protein ACYST9_02295 [Planctomycetota bacterium]|jgi:hypothetical protein
MNNLFEQLILAARRQRDSDEGGWMQLVVIVAMAIFYGVGSILKAKAEKREMQESEKTPRGRGLQQPTLRRAVGKYDQEKAQPIFIEVEEPVRVKAIPEKELEVKQPKRLSPKSSQVRDRFRKKAHAVTHPSIKTDTRKSSLDSTVSQAEEIFSLPLADADDLKRAIVYAEVLGKPIAMR